MDIVAGQTHQTLAARRWTVARGLPSRC